ncbi:Hypothetical predicted protein [Mytilus galloprovincialis]|uniref:Integrase zinc-binding domain-containing protein n=1 Tax=Mytilus galloprovincialis TaxID=29158 RepID=A0A8B6CLW0_MYTGA|nr:Hypothetical predicted protein [Mytilus galloprovincialis]
MAQEIRRVTRQAYPTAPIEIRDQLAKDCFVRAINDPKIQLSIFQREPKTIDDCVRFGLEYEAFTVDQKRLNNAKPATRMLSENDDSAEYDVVTRLAKISEQMEKLTNKEGSTICVIHPRKFEKLPIEFKPEIQRNNQRLCLADGSFVNTMGHVDLPIKIGNYTIIQKFTVAEIDVPAVIGYDFLHKNNCTIDMGKGVLLLKDSKIDCIKESQMSSTFKIKLSDKLTIPPNTEVIISGIVEGDSSSIMNAIVEPIPSKHTDTLLVAKALVDPSCGQVPIRMVNLSKYEQIMQPFTHVATCELIDTGSVSNEPRSEKLRRLSSSSCDEVNELPSLLQDLKLRSSELLNEGQIDQLESLLKRHIQTFSKNKDDLGRATAIKHKIDTGNAKPVKQPPRRLPLTKRDEDQKEIDNSDETFETVDFLRMAKVQDSQEASCSNKTDSAMWYEHKTNEEMFEAQKSDNVLFNLFRLKSDNNNRPEWADVALHDVKLKKYWSQWDRIVLINNVLYRKWINTTTEESNLQFIVPEIWKENIMKMLHDDIQVGHFGIHKTVARAQNRFYWVNHKDEITKWVQNCIVCNSRKQPPRKAKSKMKQYNVGAPMERVALDIIGPLPISYKK